MIFMGAALLVSAGGCRKKTSELDAMEKVLPGMVEAKKRDRAGDVEGAIALYHELLAEDPGLAKAHLELGLLVDRKYEDHITAIYHYNRYLDLRPDTEKRSMIEELIQEDKFLFAMSVNNNPDALVGEMSDLKEEIKGLEQDLASARDHIAELRQNLADAQARAVAAESGQTISPARASVPIEPEPRTYRVQRGDTLSKIAQKVYKDSAQWKRIYDANRETMSRSNDLDVGQVLIIP